MAVIKTIRLNNVEYNVKDVSADDKIGDLAELTTEDKDCVVDAINEVAEDVQDAVDEVNGLKSTVNVHGVDIAHIISEIGVMNDLQTTEKSNLVGAINEVFAGGGGGTDSRIGNLSNLDTDAKDSVVAAINEVDGHADANAASIGTLSSLTTTAKSDLVAAINEVNAKPSGGSDSRVGDLSTLSTDAKSTVVAAINEVDNHADTNATNIGTLSNLSTDAKSNLVAAINEVDGHADSNTANIGTLSNLSTTDKSNLVAAINEVKTGSDKVGDLSTLTTTAKSTAVAAINELDGEIGVLSTLKTTAKSTLVAATNELKDDIGKKSELNTSDKTNLVKAINEVNNLTVGSEVVIASYTNEVFQTAFDSMLAILSNMNTNDLAATYINANGLILRPVETDQQFTYAGGGQINSAFIFRYVTIGSPSICFDIGLNPPVAQANIAAYTGDIKLCKRISQTADNTLVVASVTADGVKTYGQLLNELYSAYSASGIILSGKSYLVIDTNNNYIEWQQLGSQNSTMIQFSTSFYAASQKFTKSCTLSSNSSYITSANSVTDSTNDVPVSGATLKLIL